MTDVSSSSQKAEAVTLRRVRGRRHIDRLKQKGRALVQVHLPVDMVQIINGLAREAKRPRSVVTEVLLRRALLSGIHELETEANTSAA